MKYRPIAIEVKGRKTSLHKHLLEMFDRPAPKNPTHYVIVDILNKDLSIKRVTIYFNPFDTWTNPGAAIWENDKPKWIGDLIADNLGFIGRDPNSMAYMFWIAEIATNLVIYKSYVFDYCDYDNFD